jgi:LuxR family maltose regulon positive regulatory protein
MLHYRASIWYAQQHGQTTPAILHAFSAKEWQWVADLIERHPLLSLTWGAASKHELVIFREWMKQLPADIVRSRPRLGLACVQLLWATAPYPMLQAWLDTAEATLTALLRKHPHEEASPQMLASQVRQEEENLLGEVIASRAYLQAYQEDAEVALTLCRQALALLSAENFMVRALVSLTQSIAYHFSSVNNIEIAIESGLQAVSTAQKAGQSAFAMGIMGTIALRMIGAGRLHEVQQLTQQAMQLGGLSGVPQVGWSGVFQAEIQREWNQLDAARSLIEEAISLCEQAESVVSIAFLLWGYGVLLRICLSCKDLEVARSALQECERIGMSMNQFTYNHDRSFLTTVDQVRLWLACGELDRATRWAEELDAGERHETPFILEREDVACVRVLLANNQPHLALQRLKPVLQRAATGRRWGHVIEIRILQALAYQMCHQETKALDSLSEAVRLAELEGYIRSFVDEGPPIAALLSRLREEQRTSGPTPYLDTLLAAFPQQHKTHERQSKQAAASAIAQPLIDPLSERELQVLQLLARGASNQEIAQELVIVIDTVKRHVSHIFSKLDVNNRLQAVRQARAFGLLNE